MFFFFNLSFDLLVCPWRQIDLKREIIKIFLKNEKKRAERMILEMHRTESD